MIVIIAISPIQKNVNTFGMYFSIKSPMNCSFTDTGFTCMFGNSSSIPPSIVARFSPGKILARNNWQFVIDSSPTIYILPICQP